MAKISDIQVARPRKTYKSTTTGDVVTVNIQGKTILVSVVNKEMRARGREPNPLNKGLNFEMRLPPRKNADTSKLLQRAFDLLRALFEKAGEYRLQPAVISENRKKSPFVQLEHQLKAALQAKGYCIEQ